MKRKHHIEVDRETILLSDGVLHNDMLNYNQEVVAVEKIIEINGRSSSWSHTLVNSASNCATLIAQLPGEGNRLHYHADWNEWWFIIEGEWEWNIEGKKIVVGKGDFIFIEQGKKHKITAIGNQMAIRIAVSRADVKHIYED